MSPAPARMPARQRGYSLIEIVAAFAILALGLALAMQSVGGSLRQARNAADQTEAALLAQSLLDTAGVGERLEPGETDGRFDDRFAWTLRVEPFELEEISAVGGITQVPVELMRLELEVRWGEGGRRSARFATLRALTPSQGL
jgi:general secretion pathway protein I